MGGTTELTGNTYDDLCGAAAQLDLELEPAEVAALASDHDMGEAELAALAATFGYLVRKKKASTAETLLKRSRLPRKVPKTFDNFDFGRIQGRDPGALANLPALSDIYARRNIAFIGPEGVGKTHLSQAYGYECCLRGMSAYFLKATELREKLKTAASRGGTPRSLQSLVAPSCLIVDSVGRCTFDEACTNLFFDLVDRRCEKDCPNTMIMTGNVAASEWGRFFTGDDALLCALDRLFNHASVYMMRGPSYRGGGLKTYSVEVVPQVTKQCGANP